MTLCINVSVSYMVSTTTQVVFSVRRDLMYRQKRPDIVSKET